MIDRLIEGIKQTKNPVCVGLDTMHTYLPEEFEIDKNKPLKSVSKAIFDFNREIIDSINDIVPSVKVQIAYYEQYGPAGMKAFIKTMEYAKKVGMVVIADAKRNDIGATAAAYSRAFLGGIEVDGKLHCPFECDFLTVNPYFGIDGIKPLVDDCKKRDKGLFVLVKTSNPSGGEFQDLKIYKKHLYDRVAEKTDLWGKDLIGEYGYSAVGAVVGATYKEQAEVLRKKHPHMFFLVPGYGAQGATAEDIAVNFDENGLGAVINSSRGILLAYRQEKYKGMNFKQAARAAVLEMKQDINGALEARGIKL
ncbi:MAG: orotidine-5'-phosphate decarboxylase [Christensenellaceae bacterium]|nr:orotidine-5'-phosphate decarboxylase [Christensenellaceae bacterium]